VDLVQGHLAALDILQDRPGSLTVNLGTGRGHSVLEMVQAFSRASGKQIPYRIVDRRAGDVAQSYADPSLARSMLGWEAKLGIEAMCADTWRWQCWAAENRV
jgi:UDP-glucose 4-epimerase